MIALWQLAHNTIRPNSALGYKHPAPKPIIEEQSIQEQLLLGFLAKILRIIQCVL